MAVKRFRNVSRQEQLDAFARDSTNKHIIRNFVKISENFAIQKQYASLGGVLRGQEMLKGHLPRVTYLNVY